MIILSFYNHGNIIYLSYIISPQSWYPKPQRSHPLQALSQELQRASPGPTLFGSTAQGAQSYLLSVVGLFGRGNGLAWLNSYGYGR